MNVESKKQTRNPVLSEVLRYVVYNTFSSPADVMLLHDKAFSFAEKSVSDTPPLKESIYPDASAIDDSLAMKLLVEYESYVQKNLYIALTYLAGNDVAEYLLPKRTPVREFLINAIREIAGNNETVLDTTEFDEKIMQTVLAKAKALVAIAYLQNLIDFLQTRI